MVEHDKHIGEMLALPDELGIADDTMVMYSTDNGPHMNSWSDAGMTPFRYEKNSNRESAYHVPCLVRWPGVVKPGTVCKETVSRLDWLPTIVAAAGGGHRQASRARFFRQTGPGDVRSNAVQPRA
ncbi:hypothetical protein EVC45_25745 [Paraburkholderia sp. UYCP14C]|uniref:sulfatase-like hydrolase/transferase n=1 Tax=Paraburkholderia sp. UYCP14C TaxID=2511130 RepID=UPI0010213084|nr:sulfatase-like hydrolase/transferase [Paraburkholderia sp. UYCP14C]RZF26899.1 hypothetical protein EVC45_25745 [Paraburkholderia sp. UYCP14C]